MAKTKSAKSRSKKKTAPPKKTKKALKTQRTVVVKRNTRAGAKTTGLRNGKPVWHQG